MHLRLSQVLAGIGWVRSRGGLGVSGPTGLLWHSWQDGPTRGDYSPEPTHSSLVPAASPGGKSRGRTGRRASSRIKDEGEPAVEATPAEARHGKEYPRSNAEVRQHRHVAMRLTLPFLPH